MARNNVLAEVRETGNGDLGDLFDNNPQAGLASLLALGVLVDVVDDDCAELALALLRDTQQLLSILGELDSLDGGSKLPRLEQLAGLDLP